MLTTLQAMEIVTNVDSDADMLPVDSESDNEDLLQPERNPERCLFVCLQPLFNQVKKSH